MGFADAAKAALLLHLSLFLLSSFPVSALTLPQALPPHYHDISPAIPPAHPPSHHHHHHHHPHPPTPPPVYPPPPPKTPPKPPTYAPPPKAPPKPPTYPPPPKAPTKPPTYPPPSHPPAKPPTYPKPSRSFVAVQGVVYCKSCKYKGSDTLLGAEAILNATVKLTCKNTKYKQEATARTDKNGYFFLQAPKTITSFGAHKCTVSLLSSPLGSCSKPTDLHGGIKGGALRPEKPFTANKLPFILYSVGPFAFEPKCY
ncbi:hypothetical protein V6N13_078218 [Hibiscus sabdariffa]|uniref:Uncharacterized protein n=2 Tax=Hibiscus sabdariffa TaxID=183260 RepID=A0ABR2RN04_9ROSI